MDDRQVVGLLTAKLDGVIVMENRGDSFLVYDPDGDVPYNRRFPFATVVTGDHYDSASDLGRPGAFRLNLGLTKQVYRDLFTDGDPVDYAAVDRLMPHPVYASQHWVCVVSPSERTLDEAWPLVEDAYGFAVRKHANRRKP